MKSVLLSSLAILLTTSAAAALQGEPAPDESPAQAAADDDAPADATADEPAEPNPDESADDLNSRQQLQQTFTLKRIINGEVVETEKRTVTLTPGVPYRPTEAGETVLQQVRAEFDSQVLTRVEAFEEAKLDFTIADVNLDQGVDADEYTALIRSWREKGLRRAKPQSEEETRDLAYDEFLQSVDPDFVSDADEYARRKFAFISGAKPSISREDYIREYLLDFDAMDENDDSILKGDELLRFRAACRGESVDLDPDSSAPAEIN